MQEFFRSDHSTADEKKILQRLKSSLIEYNKALLGTLS